MSKLECGPVRFSTEDCNVGSGWQTRRPALVKPAPRYSAEEWTLASTLTHQAAESEQEVCERLQAEAIRVADEAREVTLRAQEDVDWKFQERLRDMEYWRTELLRNFGDINNEIDAMTIYRQRVENALSTLCHILDVNGQILGARECRVSVDLVHDEAQKQVLHEMKIVDGIQNVLRRNMEFCTEQLRLLRKCGYNLGKELQDKDAALALDKMAYSMDEHRPEVRRQCDTCINDYSNATEMEWTAFTEKNKIEAEKTVNASLQLRINIDSVLRQICEDLRREICVTNMMFEKRLREVIEAKEKLQEQHSAISIRVRDMEGIVCKMTKAFEERQSAIALSETRLRIREKRPNLELIKDPVQRRLFLEIQENNESMAKINVKIIQAKNVLRNLLRNQLELEDAINVKTNTIGVDETKVIPLRKTIRVQEY